MTDLLGNQLIFSPVGKYNIYRMNIVNKYLNIFKEMIFVVLLMISYKVLIRVVVVVVSFVQFLFNHSVFVFVLRWTSNR